VPEDFDRHSNDRTAEAVRFLTQRMHRREVFTKGSEENSWHKHFTEATKGNKGRNLETFITFVSFC